MTGGVKAAALMLIKGWRLLRQRKSAAAFGAADLPRAVFEALPPILRPAETVETDGGKYAVRTDFRVWLYIEKTLKSNDLPLLERVAAALSAAFPVLPENPEAAFCAVLDFLACRERGCGGKAADAAENSGGNGNGAKSCGVAGECAENVKLYGLEHNYNKEDKKIAEGAAGDKKSKGLPENAAGKNQGTSESGAAVIDLYADMPFIYSAFIAEYGIDLARVSLHWHSFRALLAALSEDCTYSKIIAYRSVDTAQIKSREQRRCYERLKRAYALPDTRTEEEKTEQLAEVFSEAF